MEFPQRIIDVLFEVRTRGKVRVKNRSRHQDERNRTILLLWQRTTNALLKHVSEQADLHLCCLHGHMVVVGLFDFMLSDHGKQLKSCWDGQLSLLHSPGQA